MHIAVSYTHLDVYKRQGAYVALVEATNYMIKQNMVKKDPVLDMLAAISVGILNGEDLLDLKYSEDSAAEVDMNVVMTGRGKFVEIQGTAEGEPFSRAVSYTHLLRKRVDIAARNSADFFISIHCNAVSSSKKVSGVETYYHGGDPNGMALAYSIHPERCV